MARIRSIHAELATDEAYMAMSAFAKAAWPLLWTQCDDQGVFEWKPLVLKARILPADMIDFETILAEWERLDRVRRVEVDGKQLGVVRNFGRYQRPKKPKYLHVIPPEFRTYAALSHPSGEPTDDEPDAVPQKGENAPQMEREDVEVGEEQESKNNSPKRSGRNGVDYAFQATTIKLTAKDFARWEKSFPHLSLRGELESLDAWAGDQTNWFAAVAGALAKRERAIVERSTVKPREGPSQDIDPRMG